MIPINDKAPVRASKSILIEASPERVWSVLSNIDKWIEWNSEVQYSKLNGQLVIGTTFYWKTDSLKIISTLHTVVPNEQLGWSGKAFGTYAIRNWRIASKGQETEVWVEESMDGLLMKIFRGFMNNTLEKGLTRWLKSLKKEAEKIR